MDCEELLPRCSVKAHGHVHVGGFVDELRFGLDFELSLAGADVDGIQVEEERRSFFRRRGFSLAFFTFFAHGFGNDRILLR